MQNTFFEALESRRHFAVTPAPGNWNLQWSDEFNSTPTTPTWVQTLWGTTHFSGELQNYTPNNVSASGGMLNLTAKQESSNGFPYTSGLIDSGGDFATGGRNQPGLSFKYGYVEARMKLTKGSGLWPAFWMMPTPYADGTYHDGDGEIDIMEQVGTAPTRTEAHLHHGSTVGKSYDTGVDLSAGFHTYGLDWQADHLTWYFDGKPFYTVTSNVPNVAEYLIFNLAVGDANSWPGAPDANTVLPSTMQVDYVRVYQLSNTVAPGPGDANGDGMVDIADLSAVSSNFGKPSGATWAMGDFTGDGKVDATDLGVMATYFGQAVSSLATTAAAKPQMSVASDASVATKPAGTTSVASTTKASTASSLLSLAASSNTSSPDATFSDTRIV